MPQIPPLVDNRVLVPAQTALALDLLSRMDLLRLKAIARVYARGLPAEVAWDDLLQEALTRVIAGSRHLPESVTMVAFVAGILRSLRADYWRRAGGGAEGRDVLRLDHVGDMTHDMALADPTPDVYRELSARQELAAIERLFADDQVASKIIAGLGRGLSAEEIRLSLGLTKTTYDSARKRMRRALLREGLTCEPR